VLAGLSARANSFRRAVDGLLDENYLSSEECLI
jgi:hypothetical protein